MGGFLLHQTQTHSPYSPLKGRGLSVKKVGAAGYVVSINRESAFRPTFDEAWADLQEKLGDRFPHEAVDMFMDAYARMQQAKVPSP